MQNSPGNEVPVEIVQHFYGLCGAFNSRILHRNLTRSRAVDPKGRQPDEQAEQQQQREAQTEVCFAWQWHVGAITTWSSVKSYSQALAIGKIFGMNRFGAEVICPTFMPQNQQT